MISANLRFGILDNSVKPGFDYGCLNWAIIAGTPEWCNDKMVDMYQSLIRHNVPVMILGVGGGCDIRDPGIEHVVRKAKLLTVRESDTLAQTAKIGLKAEILPCPALLCASPKQERNLRQVRHIGLVYQGSRHETVIWNGCERETYDYLVMAMRAILAAPQFDEVTFSVICHYVDEVPLAQRDFPGLEVRYSHDSRDYYQIYQDCDALVGTRVHGIGIGASLGIPGVAIVHDQRGKTCEHFLADMAPVGLPAAELVALVAAMVEQVSARNQNLLSHKRTTMAKYVAAMHTAMAEPHVEYNNRLLQPQARSFAMEELGQLVAELDRLRSTNSGNGKLDGFTIMNEILVRLHHIEVKLDQMI